MVVNSLGGFTYTFARTLYNIDIDLTDRVMVAALRDKIVEFRRMMEIEV